MRYKELVQEGPIWQGIKGMMPGGAGFKAGYAQGQGQQEIDNLVKKASADWYKTQAAVQQRYQGQPAPTQNKAMMDAVTKHARYWFGTPRLPDYATATREREVTPKGIQSYFQIGASTYLTQHLDSPEQQDDRQQQGTQQQGTQQQGTQQQGTQQQGAGKTTTDNSTTATTGNAAPTTSTTGNAAPTTGNVSTTTSTTSNAAPTDTGTVSSEQHAIFKDPNAFKEEWDKFVASKPNYQLIADPKLLSVLKNMWMQSGGMRAESKEYRGKNK